MALRLPPWLDVEIEEPVSWALGLAAITIAWGRGNVLDPDFYVSASFLGIIIGFVGHELAHKLIAQRHGMRAGFTAYLPGLLITVASTLTPIFILAPGYVKTIAFYGAPARRLLYSVAGGPAFNIAAATACLLATIIVPPGPLERDLIIIGSINAYLAFFNLLPIPPLDGSKIVSYSPQTWGAMFAASIILLVMLGFF